METRFLMFMLYFKFREKLFIKHSLNAVNNTWVITDSNSSNNKRKPEKILQENVNLFRMILQVKIIVGILQRKN